MEEDSATRQLMWRYRQRASLSSKPPLERKRVRTPSSLARCVARRTSPRQKRVRTSSDSACVHRHETRYNLFWGPRRAPRPAHRSTCRLNGEGRRGPAERFPGARHARKRCVLTSSEWLVLPSSITTIVRTRALPWVESLLLSVLTGCC